jgi:GNAT superfamily N-acetyltransferase
VVVGRALIHNWAATSARPRTDVDAFVLVHLVVVRSEAAYDPRRMDEVVTCLEMTAPSQLVPARRPPIPLEIEEVGSAAAPLLRSVYVRIWDSLASGGRTEWSDAQWKDELSRPGVRAWVARVDDELAGFVELESEPNRDVGIVVFGLVPEFIGKGFGGAFLTWATETAWNLPSQGSGSTKRVWVQTSSGDHPHALPNYERRGFRVFRVERR